jgi:hypothetical protein
MSLLANSEICNDLLEKLAYRTWNQIAQAGAKAVSRGDGMRYMPGMTREALTRVTPKNERLFNYMERRGDQLARAGRNRLQRMGSSDNKWVEEAFNRHGRVEGEIRTQGRRNLDSFKNALNNENAHDITKQLHSKFPYVK